MMWNWMLIKLGKKALSQRKRIQVDIPFEQRSYSREDIQQPNLEEFDQDIPEDCKES